MLSTQQLAIKQDLLYLKHELLQWVIGLLLAQTALITSTFGIGIALLK